MGAADKDECDNDAILFFRKQIRKDERVRRDYEENDGMAV